MNKRIIIKAIFLKKTIAIIVGILIFVAVFLNSGKTEFVSIPKDNITIVVDAGHGGKDGGSVGKFTKVVESELNLTFAKNLKKQLEEYGFRVVMTRNDSNGLYDESAKNLKKSDMKKRKQIIENSNCDMVLSIHMNSYVLEDSCGAQVFYKKENAAGKALAVGIQNQLSSLLNNTNKKALLEIII